MSDECEKAHKKNESWIKTTTYFKLDLFTNPRRDAKIQDDYMLVGCRLLTVCPLIWIPSLYLYQIGSVTKSIIPHLFSIFLHSTGDFLAPA